MLDLQNGNSFSLNRSTKMIIFVFGIIICLFSLTALAISIYLLIRITTLSTTSGWHDHFSFSSSQLSNKEHQRSFCVVFFLCFHINRNRWSNQLSFFINDSFICQEIRCDEGEGESVPSKSGIKHFFFLNKLTGLIVLWVPKFVSYATSTQSLLRIWWATRSMITSNPFDRVWATDHEINLLSLGNTVCSSTSFVPKRHISIWTGRKYSLTNQNDILYSYDILRILFYYLNTREHQCVSNNDNMVNVSSSSRQCEHCSTEYLSVFMCWCIVCTIHSSSGGAYETPDV